MFGPELDFLSSIYGNFAVECEKIELFKISGICVFWTKFFSKRTLVFFKYAKAGKFAVECVSTKNIF